MGIGTFYNAKGVVVGQAAGFYAPEATPLPADSGTIFDEKVWRPITVRITGTPTGGTFVLKLVGGPVIGIVSTANIAFNAIASAVKSALDAVLPAGVVSTVTGGPGPATAWVVSFSGSAGAQIVLAADGALLTGGSTPAASVTASLWSAAGATEQGWASNYNVQTQDINIEEQQTPVGRNITSATYEFVANLSEDTVDSLQLALSAARTVQAADATHFGKTRLTLQPDLPVLAVALETKNRFNLPRRYYVPSATCAVNVGQTFRRAAAQRLVPVTFSSICDVEDIIIDEFTSLPTP